MNNMSSIKEEIMSDLVHVKFVLDKSGSMSVMGKEPIQSLNKFIKEQKKEGDFLFTLCLFSDEITMMKEGVHSSTLEEFKEEEYNPDGLTALYDAIGKTISNGKDSLKVIFIILTDGKENSSREYSKSAIRKMTREKEIKGWKFIYLGANQDSYTESNNIGLRVGISCDYQYSDIGLRNVMRTTSETVRILRTQNFEEIPLDLKTEENIEDKDVLANPHNLQYTTSC